MPICATYLRYSSEEQRATSIEDQLRRCRETAARLGLEIEDKHVYADAAITGKFEGLSKRAAFQRLRDDLGDRLIDVLIVDEISRLSRDIGDSMLFMQLVDRLAVRVVSADGIDTEQQNWKMTWVFKSLSAQQEIESTAWRITRGLVGQLERGYQIGPPPYGYLTSPELSAKGAPVGSKWRIHEVEAQVVREMYRRRVDGESCGSIAVDLEVRGVPPPGHNRRGGSRMWRPGTIHRIISNRIYRGVFVRFGSSATQHHARRRRMTIEEIPFERPEYRLVDDETWEQANAYRGTRNGDPRAAWGSRRRVLTGLLTCGSCGNLLSLRGDARSRVVCCPGCLLERTHGRSENWIGYTSERAAVRALDWALRCLLDEAVVAEFHARLRARIAEGPSGECRELEDRIAKDRVVESRLTRLLLDPDFCGDELTQGLREVRRRIRESTATLGRMQRESAGVTEAALQRQLAIDPRDLIPQIVGEHEDHMRHQTVLRRLVTEFAFIARPRRGMATFRITLEPGRLIASSSMTQTIDPGTLTFEVTVATTAKRPIMWETYGKRL